VKNSMWEKHFPASITTQRWQLSKKFGA